MHEPDIPHAPPPPASHEAAPEQAHEGPEHVKPGGQAWPHPPQFAGSLSGTQLGPQHREPGAQFAPPLHRHCPPPPEQRPPGTHVPAPHSHTPAEHATALNPHAATVGH